MNRNRKKLMVAGGLLLVILFSIFSISCASVRDKEIAEKMKAAILETDTKNVEVKVTGQGIQLTAGGLNFPGYSAEITPETAAELEKIAKIIKTYKDRHVLIQGHTADIGDKKAQLDLSYKRAESVANFLLSKDAIAKGKYTIEGKGGEMPISREKTEEANAKNRRVEIILLR